MAIFSDTLWCDTDFGVYNLRGAARTRAPAATNYDVHSPTVGRCLGQNSPSGSAMEAPALNHRPCWSPIHPAQVSMFSQRSAPSIYSYSSLHPLYVGYSLMYSFWRWCCCLASLWDTTTSTTNHIVTHWFLYVLYMCMYIVDRGRGKEITYHTHQPHL